MANGVQARGAEKVCEGRAESTSSGDRGPCTPRMQEAMTIVGYRENPSTGRDSSTHQTAKLG